MTKAKRLNPDNMWPSFGFPFHHAVVEPKGKRVHVSGQVAWDKDRNIIGLGDAKAQTKYTLSNIDYILKSAGGSLDDVVSINLFYTNQDDYEDICLARKEVLSLEHGPASTAVKVAGLVHEDLLVEISAIAVIPEI